MCRASAGDCDIAENCDGADITCPTDGFESAATECRASAGDCDVAENCSGGGAACPGDAFVAAATECRAPTGDCDVAEACTGSNAACPTDGFADAATECRASAGDCDVAENCSGSAAACPIDALADPGTVCRAGSGDACDPAETCTGSATDCPSDAVASAATVCRTSGGTCDVIELCTGVAGEACPTDSFQSSEVVCRAAAGECDLAETCTGVVATCPANAKVSTGTPCTDEGNICTDNKCNGAGACVASMNRVPCNDGNACTTGDVCSAGQCQPGGATNCDDGTLCTTDSCNTSTGCVNLAEVRDVEECYIGASGKFYVTDSPQARKKSIRWSWKRGEVVEPADFGIPRTPTTYELCVIDHAGGTPRLASSLVIPPSLNLWSSTTPSVLKYTNQAGTADGVTVIRAKASPAPLKSKFTLKARGLNLTLPTPGSNGLMFDSSPLLSVQLLNSTGACWTTDFTLEDAPKNTTRKYRGKFK